MEQRQGGLIRKPDGTVEFQGFVEGRDRVPVLGRNPPVRHPHEQPSALELQPGVPMRVVLFVEGVFSALQSDESPRAERRFVLRLVEIR